MRLNAMWIGAFLGLAVVTGQASAEVVGPESGLRAPVFQGSGLPGYALASYAPSDAATYNFYPERYGVPQRLTLGPAAAAQRGRPAVRYDAAFLEAQPVASGDAQWQCLAQAVYFEARGESVRGQFAVAEVILNRVDSPLYPKTICAVVHQGGSGGCQFSFTCDGVTDRIREKDAFRVAGKIARLMLDGAARDLTDGATHFHTRGVRPGWAHRMPRTASIGRHLFYRIAAKG